MFQTLQWAEKGRSLTITSATAGEGRRYHFYVVLGVLGYYKFVIDKSLHLKVHIYKENYVKTDY